MLEKTSELKLPTGVLSVDVDAEGNSLVAGCVDGVYHVRLDSKETKKLYSHKSYVSSVAWLSEMRCVSAGYDGVLRWYDLGLSEPYRTVHAHDFWSWDMALSPSRDVIASVTGQYLAGGYKYEPMPEREPSIKLLAAETGDVIHELPHVPSVQAVAFSPGGEFVAAGNLMGETRVYDVATGNLAGSFQTEDFTSWGIIKSHCYLGGIFAMEFAANEDQLLLAGMGPMRDPMAGNGRQLWQKWSWRGEKPMKADETHEGESGEGLMEALAIHPDGDRFVMGGRLRGGDWNLAMFELNNGNRLSTQKTGYRVTDTVFTNDGTKLIVVGAQGQPSKKREGSFPPWGRVEVYAIGPSSPG